MTAAAPNRRRRVAWVLLAPLLVVTGIAVAVGFALMASVLARMSGHQLLAPYPMWVGSGATVLVCLAALACLRMSQDRPAAPPPAHRRTR